jgi:hypothetical protein
VALQIVIAEDWEKSKPVFASIAESATLLPQAQ